MFTVKKKPLTSNMIWDAENEKPLCRFVKGVLETNDEALVEKLSEMGHTVSGEADATNPEPIEPPKSDDEGEQEDSGEDTEKESTGEADATPSTTGTKRRSRK